MPHRAWEFRVADIVDSIEKILSYTAGMSFEQFRKDSKTIDAVIRNFTIIGEAARHIPDEIVQSHPEIPWREMADLRNIIVHEYSGVNEKIIWETIQTDLPGLLSSLRKMV
ncbi:MAG: DUF86 domain-containing protein [Desulfobacterales bacterium]|jgi:uncharacterized protein with HEPN domain